MGPMEQTLSHAPEYHSFEEFQNRKKKLEEIEQLGINPYPHQYSPTHFANALHKEFTDTSYSFDNAASSKTPDVTISGRLVLFRAMGKNIFAHLQDESGKVQVLFNRDLTSVTGLKDDAEIKPIKFIEKKLDLGDILGVEGNVFFTQKGELTVFVKKLTLLSKSLLPLPDKHGGLADKGIKYRKRWLDLISDKESFKRFQIRSKIFSLTRKFMEEKGFMEVETPILQNTYGGAEATPFVTELNALHQEMFMRISLEIPLKKLIVGGFEKIYELGKVFRNEGLDRTHNPEFSMLEAYAANWDYNDMMEFVEQLHEKIALDLFGTTKIETEAGVQVDLKAPWKRLSMKDSIKEYGKIDVDTLSDEQIRTLLQKKPDLDLKKVEKAKTRGALIALVFEEFVEEHLVQPHHIIDHPIETTPLCKLHRDPKLKKERFVERFESFILGTERVNSYTELNDPIIQRELLEEQARKKLEGDTETHPLDEEFIESICQGMPPTAGVGIGMDRLVMLFTKAFSIRDVILFPIMKPED